MRKSIAALSGFMISALLLGGCLNTDNQEMMNQSKETAIKYFKEEFNLNVQITRAKKLPVYVAFEINVQGHVIGHKDQIFNLSVNYKTNEPNGFTMSPELEKAIIANGFDPYKKTVF